MAGYMTGNPCHLPAFRTNFWFSIQTGLLIAISISCTRWMQKNCLGQKVLQPQSHPYTQNFIHH